jgi:hypothetical protein
VPRCPYFVSKYIFTVSSFPVRRLTSSEVPTCVLFTDFTPAAGGINEINLDDYFPNHRSYNSVVYYHKQFLDQQKAEKPKITKEEKTKMKKKGKKQSMVKHDKGQQYNNENAIHEQLRFELLETGRYVSVLENTLRLNKKIIPIIIPTVNESSSEPLCYTVKTKKLKRNDVKTKEHSVEKDATYNKEKARKMEQKKCKNKQHSCSPRDLFDPLSQNTLDDIHLNINQSSTFSESSCKYRKREHDNEKVTNNSCKYYVSNSFDALATESVGGNCNKIKIHLMTDGDKKEFIETFRNPIVNAIKECLRQYNNNNDVSTELKTMQNALKCNNQKLEKVLLKLTYLEEKLNSHAEKVVKPGTSPQMQFACKASKLEELDKDACEVKEEYSSEDNFVEDLEMRKRRITTRNKSVVVALDDKYGKDGNKKEGKGGGEVSGNLNASASISQLGAKPERPNRIPARFCWTDADRL